LLSQVTQTLFVFFPGKFQNHRALFVGVYVGFDDIYDQIVVLHQAIYNRLLGYVFAKAQDYSLRRHTVHSFQIIMYAKGLCSITGL
jgi:hypothetical protein